MTAGREGRGCALGGQRVEERRDKQLGAALFITLNGADLSLSNRK